MNLDFFKDLENNFRNSEVKEIIDKFINELSNFIENNSKTNIVNETNKYSEYWKYQNFMEENVSSKIGLSRWANDITYRDELSEAVDDSILELSKSEGTLYRKQFTANGSVDGSFYNIDKFENGKIERYLKLPADKIPSKYKDEDIIFQYKQDGKIKVREDLKDKIINLASEKCEELKLKESEKAEDYKREGHIYEAIEDDGYIFLKDLTEQRDYVLEDIDFVVDCYEGGGNYQVIDGEYKKIDD